MKSLYHILLFTNTDLIYIGSNNYKSYDEFYQRIIFKVNYPKLYSKINKYITLTVNKRLLTQYLQSTTHYIYYIDNFYNNYVTTGKIDNNKIPKRIHDENDLCKYFGDNLSNSDKKFIEFLMLNDYIFENRDSLLLKAHLFSSKICYELKDELLCQFLLNISTIIKIKELDNLLILMNVASNFYPKTYALLINN